MIPHVLLSNDDGVFAPGLRALADAFLADGWRVSVCAPASERSAASHSITIRHPIVAAARAWEGVVEGAPLAVWACSGTPADCVKVAILKLCNARPDLVVSGVNNGWNLGTDVHYSGTVGAAMEGAFEGVPGMAVSAPARVDASRSVFAAACAVRLARRMLARPIPPRTVLSLNVPDRDGRDVLGLVEAPMTPIRYTDDYDEMTHSRSRSAYWLKGEIIEEGRLPGGDLDRLLAGYATVTLLGWDLTLPGGCKEILQDMI